MASVWLADLIWCTVSARRWHEDALASVWLADLIGVQFQLGDGMRMPTLVVRRRLVCPALILLMSLWKGSFPEAVVGLAG
eukprot:CAMPEP_0203850936 /NCGR_PEP_ID=MMETSP0359-20131031/7055_1 /ASSEMBLY_ACC=CAM_ASM_000338 /TAXON_ID=268821 /ORGANISM="Scrippsiella Hangoei, Strain SHTV-5" /LENGTH=79 /DNA_ID=CAMNT_0050766883 /DNA_START=43 /DNA_END=279 /DNA_ORIENTATION=-